MEKYFLEGNFLDGEKFFSCRKLPQSWKSHCLPNFFLWKNNGFVRTLTHFFSTFPFCTLGNIKTPEKCVFRGYKEGTLETNRLEFVLWVD